MAFAVDLDPADRPHFRDVLSSTLLDQRVVWISG
jgi:hypothetical protein